MAEFGSLAHTKSDRKYHIVWILKYQKEAQFGAIRIEYGPVLRELVSYRERSLIEGEMTVDHGHMLIWIPPKHMVAQVAGYMKGKSALHATTSYLGQRRNFSGQHFWASGYYVSTVWIDEGLVRQ